MLELRQNDYWDTLQAVMSSRSREKKNAFLAQIARADNLVKLMGSKKELEAKLSALVDGRRIMQLRPDIKGKGIGEIKQAVRDFIVSRQFDVSQQEVDTMIYNYNS